VGKAQGTKNEAERVPAQLVTRKKRYCLMLKNYAPARRAKSRNENEPPAALVEHVRRRGHETKVAINGVPPAALKMPEARAYLGGLSVPTMHRLVERGLLRPNRSTRHLIFLRSELDRFLEAGMA
jgi:Helix-turn-helix domain